MAPLSPTSPEKGLNAAPAAETQKLIVRQPAPLKELGQLLDTIESFTARVSERSSEDRSGDMGGGGTGAKGGTQQDDGQAVSPRDLAIQQIPHEEKVLREKLAQHIDKEMRVLNVLVKRASRSRQPGSAHKLNEVYARIRRLNSLLAEILQSSLDLLKKLYIRVFVDRQPIL